MSWEHTKAGTRCYTRSFRRNGRVVREYCGFGLAAELAAEIDSADRAVREAQWNANRKAVATDKLVRQLERESDLLVRATLYAAGYRRCARGAWYKWNGIEVVTMAEKASNVAEDLRDLVRRAELGERHVLPALQKAFAEQPEVWRSTADLGCLAREAQINLAAGENVALREALHRKLAEMERELGSDSASLMERLLIERVAITWLQVTYADAMLAQVTDVDLRQAAFMHDRVDRAHRRLLSATRQLAVVRKLLPVGTMSSGSDANKVQANQSRRRKSKCPEV